MAEMYLAFMRGIGIDVVVVSGSNLTCFLCGGQSPLWFCVRAEKMLGFNDSGIEIDLVLSAGIEVDTVFVCGPKMTCF